MFTGIVTHAAPVKAMDMQDGILRLVVEVPNDFNKGVVIGASIAVNGVCLTVVAFNENSVSFDVIDESLKRTNLGGLTVGSLVNLERAAKFGDEIGGHLLSGHIHVTAVLLSRQETGGNVALEFQVSEQWSPYIISKGYIALNGCSLTIGEVDSGRFWLHLIPETLRVTNFGDLAEGMLVNVEIDHQTQVIVETVHRYLEAQKEEG